MIQRNSQFYPKSFTKSFTVSSKVGVTLTKAISGAQDFFMSICTSATWPRSSVRPKNGTSLMFSHPKGRPRRKKNGARKCWMMRCRKRAVDFPPSSFLLATNLSSRRLVARKKLLALRRYLHYTDDRTTLHLLLPVLIDIAEHHLRGTRFNIHVDPQDGLLAQGSEGYQLTWMDAKMGEWVVTPRRGKAVEINALWYN